MRRTAHIHRSLILHNALTKSHFLLALTLVGLLVAGPASAQEKTGAPTPVPQLVPKVFIQSESPDQGKETKASTAPLPGLADVAPRAAELGQKAIKAEEAIAAIKNTGPLER